jgi:spermidine/putrescine transport system substrate-binding protein
VDLERDSRLAITAPLTRRRLLRYGAGAFAGLALPGSLLGCGDDEAESGGSAATTASEGPAEAPTPSGKIDYFGWEGEDLKGVKPMDRFLESNGVSVKSTYMPTLDDITPKLQGGNSGVDVLGFTAQVTPRLAAQDVLEPLDAQKLPNLEKLLPRWTGESPFWTIEGERVFVPCFFQTFAVIYNSEEVTDPPNNFRGLLEPEFKGKITTWAEPNGAFGIMSAMLGIEQGKVPKDRIEELADLFSQFLDQSKSVSASPGDIVTQLVSGEVVAAMLGTPQFTLFANFSGGKGKAIKSVVDVEGGNISFTDGYGIPVGADNADSAYAFINQVLDPKTNAAASNAFAGGVTVEGAEEFLDEATKGLYPSANLDQILEKAPLQVFAPLESDEYVTQGEWIERFTQLTS